MKKISMLVFVIMMLTFVAAVGAEVRPGGLPALEQNDKIRNCNCRTDSSSCAQTVAYRSDIMEKGRQTLDVEFDFNKSIIKQGYYKDIDDLAQVMKDNPDLKVVIEGHTDNVGTAAYNKKLSQRRAEAVKKYMVEEDGINAHRITAKGFGFDRPIASNDTDEGRQKNRRVEAAVDY
jgi:outer membrane protein OmpA-like peptidoglycan-associated protein